MYCERVESTLRHENQRLSKELEDAQLDLEDARRSRREMQQQLNIITQRLGQFNMDNENLKVAPYVVIAPAFTDTAQNRNPYIMVLIDGDGMIVSYCTIRMWFSAWPATNLLVLQFNTELIQQGLEGGKKAANTLRNAVLEQCPDLPEDTEVIAKVCANLMGLGKAMKRDGCLENIEDLRDFTLGFTQGKASFDFIDVGHGKERADSKIKGLYF